MLTRITRRVEIPGESDQWLDLRLLSWRQLAEARETQATAALRRVAVLGPGVTASLRAERAEAARNAEIASARGETPEAEPAGDPLAAYDVGVVLKHGITGWSYPDELTAANIDALDEATALWAAREILGFKPQSEAERTATFFRA